MGRVLVLHPCDSGLNPTVDRFFFFCLSRIRDTRLERVLREEQLTHVSKERIKRAPADLNDTIDLNAEIIELDKFFDEIID